MITKVRKIYLRAWGNAWILHNLDPQTGKHSWEKMIEPLQYGRPTHGFASIEPVFGLVARFYAVYAFEGRLYFQAGRRKWDITDAEVRAGHWCWFGLTSRFCLFLNGRTVHKVVLVHPTRAFWPFLDPTYDSIDLESDHFLWFLSRNITSDDWRQHVLSMESKPDTNVRCER